MKTYRMKEGVLMQAVGRETLSSIAHDLRTPMCCVSGAAQMALLASRQGQGVDEQMRQILMAVESMERMLEQMCGAAQGRICCAGQLERTLRSVMTPRALSRSQTLKIDFGALSGAAGGGIDAGMERVLLNLVSNAIKYTQDGGTICVGAHEAEGRIVFTVRDNGMGMKREFIRQMFVPFARAQESAHLPGKGLGLSIVRRLVRQMGGAISVRSTWGKGTEFTVSVPIQKSGNLAYQ